MPYAVLSEWLSYQWNLQVFNWSCKANPDLLLKPEIRPEDGVQNYSSLLCYVDDILCIHHNANDVFWWLHYFFPLKPRFCIQDMYLDVKLHKTRLNNVVPLK